jgi:4-amino-4-deoxy-L-arabinose transferase-like glycosyltransferase
MNKILKNYLPLIIILLLCGFLFTLHANRNLLVDWDECVYAQQAKEMKETGNFITNQWNRALVFEKPPLYNILTQPSYLFGANELTARIPVIIESLLLLAFLYIFSKRIFSERVAILSTLILVSTHLFLVNSTRNNTDIGFTLFIFLGYFYWTQILKNKYYAIVSGILFGLAVLTKGLGVIPYLIALGVTVLYIWDRKTIVSFIQMIIVFLATMLPWHVYEYMTYGQAFFQVYIMEHIIKRANNTLDFHFEGRLFYVKLITKEFFPWILALFIPIVFSFLRIRNHLTIKKIRIFLKKHYQIMSILTVIIIVLISITRVKTRIEWYALPLYPFIAIFLGYSIDQLLQKIRVKYVSVALYLVLAIWALYNINATVDILSFNRTVAPANAVAIASQKEPQQEINYLVWFGERKAEAILPQNMRTSTTFVYGGNPCMVYYSNKKVNYFYSVENFQKDLKTKKGLYLIENGDLHFFDMNKMHIKYKNSDYTLFTN